MPSRVRPDKDPDGINSLDRAMASGAVNVPVTCPIGQALADSHGPLTDNPSAHPQVNQHAGGGRADALTAAVTATAPHNVAPGLTATAAYRKVVASRQVAALT